MTREQVDPVRPEVRGLRERPSGKPSVSWPAPTCAEDTGRGTADPASMLARVDAATARSLLITLQSRSGNQALQRLFQKRARGTASPTATVQRQRVHMESGRYVGDVAGTENNLREEVLMVMDRLAGIGVLAQPDYLSEYATVSALAPASVVPKATIPKTIAAIAASQTGTLDPAAARYCNITISGAVGRGQPNAKDDVKVIQDVLHVNWLLSNATYTTERGAVDGAPGPGIDEALIPGTIAGIIALKEAHVAGTYGPTWIDQIRTSAQAASMVGRSMTWGPSGATTVNTFTTWAKAASEGPAPALDPATRINCWETVLLAAYREKVLSWAKIHAVYAGSTAGWASRMTALLGGGSVPYAPGNPDTPRPQNGHVVFFDGLAHVALANGVVDGTGRSQVISFWPPPNTPFTPGGTLDQVKLTTIEELNTYWTGLGKPAFKVTFGHPGW